MKKLCMIITIDGIIDSHEWFNVHLLIACNNVYVKDVNTEEIIFECQQNNIITLGTF